MLEFYKTTEAGDTRAISEPERGCWINAVAPSKEERNYLIESIGVLPEFVKSSLDEEESSHIDYDDDVDQTLVIADYPKEDPDSTDRELPAYITAPIGVVLLKGYIVTICLHENSNIKDLRDGQVRSIDTRLKTRFLLQLLLRISQRYLFYLRQIDRLSSRTERRLYRSMENKELLGMLELEKSLVYFSTSLKSDEMVLQKIMRARQIKLYEEDEDLLEDVMIEVRQAAEMCEIIQNIISNTMDGFSNVISNNMNIIMKELTVITIVMSIPNMIYGFYGMNVSGLPLPYSWFPLVLSVLCCVLAWYYFKNKSSFH